MICYLNIQQLHTHSMPGFCRLRMHTKGSHNLTSTSTTTTSTITNATNTSTTSTNSNATAIANYHGVGNNNNNSNANHPVAFIEFKDTVSAATAMQQLQGKYLLSSDRGSIRIEFAKTKMINDTMTGSGSAKHNNNNHNNNNNNSNNNEALAMQKAANAMNATQLLAANNMTAVSPAGTAMTLISNQPPQPQLIILNGYAQQQQQQQQQVMQQQVQQQQQQQQALLQTAGVMQQQAILPTQHFITTNGGTATAVAYPAVGGGLQAMSAVGPSLATIFTSTNSTNNLNNLNNTTSTTNLNNNNGINVNNINNNNNNNSNNNNIVHNRSTALPPPTVVVNSLQHQLHPTQHQNHLFRDVRIGCRKSLLR